MTDRLRELHDTWMDQQANFADTPEGRMAAAAVRLCARELLAVAKNPRLRISAALALVESTVYTDKVRS